MENNSHGPHIFKVLQNNQPLTNDTEDWDACRKDLITLSDAVPHEILAAKCTRDFSTAMHYFHLFVKTGLDCSPKGTPTRRLFIAIASYIVRNAPPELQEVLKKGIEMLSKYITPTGFTNTGKPCYSMKQLCRVLDMDEEEILAFVQDECVIT